MHPRDKTYENSLQLLQPLISTLYVTVLLAAARKKKESELVKDHRLGSGLGSYIEETFRIQSRHLKVEMSHINFCLRSVA